MRHFLLATAAPGAAATTYSVDLPISCNLAATKCVTAQPMVNPDGSLMGAGSGSGAATPTGTAGAPTASVISVQGVTGGTSVPITASTLPLPTGAATASAQASMLSALGSPMQQTGGTVAVTGPIAGITGPVTLGGGTANIGYIQNTGFAATQSGAWDMRNITGTVSLPTGASTAAGQATEAGYLATIAGNSGTANAPAIWTQTGTFTAANQTIDLVAPGSGSVLLDIQGTFVGTITAFGCADTACTVPGGRLLFKSGIGSLGSNSVTSDGTVAVSREYRLVAGGNRVRLVATSWTSGSASIIMHGQPGNNIVFVNGPVHNAEEEALRAARAYVTSTGIQAVAAGSFLNATLTNPSGSSVNYFITDRTFECNAASETTPGEWTSFVGPTTVPTTVSTMTNRMPGGPPAVTTFRYQVATSTLAGGTQSDAGFLVTGGPAIPASISKMSVIVPGQTVGWSIGGAGGGLTATQRCKITIFAYQEVIN